MTVPEVGYEVEGEHGEVIAELEVAWPEQRVGIALHALDAPLANWRVVVADEVVASPELIRDLLAHRPMR
jgi:hypothetical protein